MRNRYMYLLFLLAFSLLLVACGDASSTPVDQTTSSGETEPGDPVRGEELYKQNPVGAASTPGCITCHSLTQGQDLVGPSHYAMGTLAESRVSGQSAEAYLRESIVDPDAYVVDGYSKGVMLDSYGNELTDQEIEDMVAFLLTLK